MVYQGAISSRPKIWTAKSKRDLEVAFDVINPCTERDWVQVADALSGKWSVDDIKTQVKKMKLTAAAVVKKPKTPQTDSVKKLRSLIPNGKIPNKGTIRREVVEDEVMQQLYVLRDDTEAGMNNKNDDLDDQFIRDAMREYALDNIWETPERFKTPSRRTFFPRSVSSSRSVESQEEVKTVGDDFSTPDRKIGSKYRYKYRADQLNRRHEKKSKIVEEENESIFEKSESEEELS